MTSYFGILPSAGLSQDIKLAQANRDSKNHNIRCVTKFLYS